MKNKVAHSIVDLDVGNLNLGMSMREKMQIALLDEPSLLPTIYRIPESIRQADKMTTNVYNPYIISIGPLHRGEPHLQAMEKHKWRFLRNYLSRNPDKSLDFFLMEIKRKEELLRSYYSETIALESSGFVEMMVLDGCFIAEYLLKRTEGGDQFLEGPVWIYSRLVHDMLLLENQIPFFILQWLYDLVDMPGRLPLSEGALRFLTKGTSFNVDRIPKAENVHHLLHLYHSFLMPTVDSQNPQLLHSNPGYLLSTSESEMPPLLHLNPSRLLLIPDFMFKKMKHIISLFRRRHLLPSSGMSTSSSSVNDMCLLPTHWSENPHLAHLNPSRLRLTPESENPHLLRSKPSCLVQTVKILSKMMKHIYSLFRRLLLCIFRWFASPYFCNEMCLLPTNSENTHLLHLKSSHLRLSPVSENPHLLRTNTSCILQTLEFNFRRMKHVLSSFCRNLLPIIESSTSSLSDNELILPKLPTPTIPSATELHEAGIKFRKKKADSYLDIEFNNGVMKIPSITIDYSTYSIFKNLIALEQCYPNSQTFFTKYARFMDFIVNTAKDVELLHKKEIIIHSLGSHEEVALFFNSLCKEVTQTHTSYLSRLFDEVGVYYGSNWNVWRTRLKRDYFSTPWAYISFGAALILLVLTFLQTLFSIHHF